MIDKEKTVAIIGTQWGDEGKGKISHLLSDRFDCVVRYQGGANAGHTICCEGELFSLHQIPSGILVDRVTCVLANGMVIDIEALYEEIIKLEKRGISVDGRLFISDIAHMVFPYHKIIDKNNEKSQVSRVGTTQKGISPAYVDKVSRVGIRVVDYMEPDTFLNLLDNNLNAKTSLIDAASIKKIRQDILGVVEKLRAFFQPFICNTSILLDRFLKERKSILFEGAQGSCLDLDHGTYPYVTSSNPVVGAISHNCGIRPKQAMYTCGITKAYTTRVGEGPFITELHDGFGDILSKKGHEFGTTTGRKRRCGWLDLLIVKNTIRINGVDSIILTKLDILENIHPLKVCVAYQIDGQIIHDVPNSRKLLKCAEPVYYELDGFEQPVSQIKKFSQFPTNVKRYISFIEDQLKIKISLVSLGADRDSIVNISLF